MDMELGKDQHQLVVINNKNVVHITQVKDMEVEVDKVEHSLQVERNQVKKKNNQQTILY